MIPIFRGVCALVALCVVGCDDLHPTTYPDREEEAPSSPEPPAPVTSGPWYYHTGIDALGQHYAQAVTEAPNTEYMYLLVWCRDGTFDVAFDPGFHLGYVSSDVRYSIDGAPRVNATWGDSRGWILYRGGPPVAFAELLARSETLELTARGWDGSPEAVERTSVFKLDGLSPHLPAIRSICGV